MRRLALIVILLGLAGCVNDQPAGTEPNSAAPAGEAAAPVGEGGAADAKGRTPFTHCLDLTRERRYAEALTVCREAEKTNPGDQQIQKAIQMAEQGGSAAPDAAAEGKSD